MKILLLGKNGQVGWALQRSLAPLGEVLAWDRHSEGGDLSDLDALARTVASVRPDVIVNAAAYTAVDKAQAETELCHTINADAVAVLARATSALGALLVHYSTDYVFNGSGDVPWVETDPTGPLNVYGQSKLAGEHAIAISGCAHLIFRTSWVYGLHGGNFAKTMLRLAQEREQLQVINDQCGAPTSAELIAQITAHAIPATQGNVSLRGLYHLAAVGETTWHGYAQHLIAQARAQRPNAPWTVKSIEPVPTSAFPTPARRPHNSRLNTQKLQAAFGLTLPRWEAGVDAFAALAMTH